MVRLYNHTRYDDGVLRSVLNFAARAAGVDGDVPVKVTYCRHLRGGGMAHDGWPYLKTLKGRPTTSKDKRILQTPIGWVEVHLPRSLTGHINTKDPPMDAAEWFVDVAIHEMAHIRQHRSNMSDAFYGKRFRSRRVAHDRRPCEIDAYNTVDAVQQNRQRDKRRQELVIALATELENSAGRTKEK